jgi:hemoglobin-like flavoprotein
LTPAQIELVQTSFRSVKPIADQAADLFYGRLFEIAPAVRPLFPDDLTEQKKKLMAMLATAVTNLHQVETIVPGVEDLGRRHSRYGVTPEHYKPVGEALLWTLEKGLGPAFTPPVKEAWSGAYTTLASVMTSAAAKASPPPARKGILARLFG